jgi:hypothetical protein
VDKPLLILGAVLLFAAGFSIGWAVEWVATPGRRERRVSFTPCGSNRSEGRKTAFSIASVTRWLFVTAQIAALCWVSISYLIALYATLRLGQVFPVVELSQQAINTILGVSGLKVVENIFEHNDGKIFGQSKAVSDLDTGPEKENVSESDTFSDL